MISRLRLWRHTMCFVFLVTCVFTRSGMADPLTRLHVDSRLGFSVRFPADAVVTVGHGSISSSPVYNYDPITQTPAIVIELNPASYKGTNLASAGVYVAVSNDPNILPLCIKALDGEQRASQPVKRDGVQFASFTVNDGGAGTILHWASHRALIGHSCYEIVEWLSWGNTSNYEPGTIKEFDGKVIESQLGAIRQSFEFRNVHLRELGG
jgi:hypothetical protein